MTAAGTVRRWLVAGFFAGFLVTELISVLFPGLGWWPLTRVVKTYIPPPVIALVVTWLVTWLPGHFSVRVRRAMQTGWALSVLRTLTQLVVGYAFTWLASQGFTFPDEVSGRARDLLMGAVIVGWIAGVRWLETRRGTGRWPRLARRLGRVLMLGIGSQPAYVPPGGAVQAQSTRAGVTAVAVDELVPGMVRRGGPLFDGDPEHLQVIRPPGPDA